jgi:hydrogenase maturation protease
VLVIGYGSSLRRDGAAGLIVAERLRALGRPDVSVIAVPQLTPELALPISESRLCIFVDASSDPDNATVRMRSVRAEGTPNSTHSSDPSGLLALAKRLYDGSIRSWLLMIPVEDLSLGEGLSSLTRRCVDEAVKTILLLIESDAAAAPTSNPWGEARHA